MPNYNRPVKRDQRHSSNSNSSQSQRNIGITQTIVKYIDENLNSENSKGFKDYDIRHLVKHAEEFGSYLKNEGVETNQIRKFLDAINQLKTELAKDNDFTRIETGVVLLKPKLAYAAARQKAAKPLSQVMSKAIDKVETTQDFERLVQFIESIIAYHKAAGGK